MLYKVITEVIVEGFSTWVPSGKYNAGVTSLGNGIIHIQVGYVFLGPRDSRVFPGSHWDRYKVPVGKSCSRSLISSLLTVPTLVKSVNGVES